MKRKIWAEALLQTRRLPSSIYADAIAWASLSTTLLRAKMSTRQSIILSEQSNWILSLPLRILRLAVATLIAFSKEQANPGIMRKRKSYLQKHSILIRSFW